MKLLKESGQAKDSLGSFQRGYGNSDALQSRILRLWAEYEEAISNLLTKEQSLELPSADICFLSAQLVALIRSATWREVYLIVVQNPGDPAKAVEKLLTAASKRINQRT